LAVSCDDGGSVETIVKPIPIVLKKLHVEFFPVGGDLVAGVPNRVYFLARTPLGKPADLQGRVVDDQGKTIQENVHPGQVPDQPAANQGIGQFEFAPEPGRSYELKIDVPKGIEGRFSLPAVRPDRVAMNVPSPVTGQGEAIEVTVYSAGKDRKL